MTYHVKFTDEEIKQLAKDIARRILLATENRILPKAPAPPVPGKEKQWPGGPEDYQTVQKPSPLHTSSPPAHSQPLPPPARDVQQSTLCGTYKVTIERLNE